MEDDNKEAVDYELSAMVLVAAEELHQRYCVRRFLEGRKPADFETYLNMLVVEGMQSEGIRLETAEQINKRVAAAVTEDRFVK